ncbi:hypothetical protein DL96DRAFT_1620511 [Flagelloscypha sp. PMI_526]|nr:hypothetical protein DL96DRAFT_1620511 [Flagelloscypha sp. PMI_526]
MPNQTLPSHTSPHVPGWLTRRWFHAYIWASIFIVFNAIWFLIMAIGSPQVGGFLFHIWIVSLISLVANIKMFRLVKAPEDTPPPSDPDSARDDDDDKKPPVFKQAKTHVRVLMYSGVIWFSLFIAALINTIFHGWEDIVLIFGILATIFTFFTFVTYWLGAISLRILAAKWEKNMRAPPPPPPVLPAHHWSRSNVSTISRPEQQGQIKI